MDASWEHNLLDVRFHHIQISQGQNDLVNVPRLDFGLHLLDIIQLSWIPRRFEIHRPKIILHGGAHSHQQGNLKNGYLSHVFSRAQSVKIVQKLLSFFRNQPEDIQTSNPLKVRNAEVIFQETDGFEIGAHAMDIDASITKNTLTLAGTFTLSSMVKGGFHFSLRPDQRQKHLDFQGSSFIKNLPFDDLPYYWPPQLSPTVRHWVTTELSHGDVDYADIHLQGRLDHKGHSQIKALTGKIDVRNMTLNIFEGFPRGTQLSGTAKYNRQDFKIGLKSGKVKDVHLQKGQINIFHLDEKDQFLELDLDLQSSIQEALNLLHLKPLEFTKKLEMPPMKVKGQNKTRLQLNFPVKKSLTLDQIKANVQALLTDVSLKIPLPVLDTDLAFQKGTVQIQVDNQGLHVKGMGYNDDHPLNIIWFENFHPQDTVKTTYDLQGRLPPQFGKYLKYCGDLPTIHLQWLKNKDDSAVFVSKWDFTQCTLKIPALGIHKPKQQTAIGYFDFLKSKTEDYHLHKAQFYSPTLSFSASGRSWLSNKNYHHDYHLYRFRSQQTDIGGHLTSGDTKHLIKIFGKSLDLSKAEWDPNDMSIPSRPLQISAEIDKVILKNDQNMYKLFGQGKLRDGVWYHLLIQAFPNATSMKPGIVFRKDYVQEKSHVALETQDAGALLQGVGITKTFKGGNLSLHCSKKTGDKSWLGQIRIRKAELTEAPVLAQLLSMASPFGLVSMVSDQGLRFPFISAKFQIDKNCNVIIRQCRALGAALGLTAKGRISLMEKSMKVTGSVASHNTLNLLLSKVPGIKHLLGEGIFGVVYMMKGDLDHPTISLNPFSALTPGFIRSFFEEDVKFSLEDLDPFLEDDMEEEDII